MKKLLQASFVSLLLLNVAFTETEEISEETIGKYEVQDLLKAIESNQGLEKANPKTIPVSIALVQSKDYKSGLSPDLIGQKVVSVLREANLSYIDFDELSEIKQKDLREKGILSIKVVAYSSGIYQIYSKFERKIFFQTDTEFYQEISPSWHRLSFGVVNPQSQVKAIFDYLDKDTKIFLEKYKKANRLEKY